jgi:hypothetical protein
MNDDVRTVSIPVDEYVDLRLRAGMCDMLLSKLSEIEGRYYDFERRIWEVEQKLKGGAE